jgi:hypothetical protein
MERSIIDLIGFFSYFDFFFDFVNQSMDSFSIISQNLIIKRIILSLIDSVLPSFFCWILIFDMILKPDYYDQPWKLPFGKSEAGWGDFGGIILVLVLVLLLGIFVIPALLISLLLPFNAEPPSPDS